MKQYSIDIDKQNHIIRVKAWGRMNPDEGKGLIIEARKLALTYESGILYDIQELELEGASLFDFYYLPREHEVFSKPESRKMKVAIVVSEINSQKSKYDFYEDVTHNLGFQVRVFMKKEDAESWIKA